MSRVWGGGVLGSIGDDVAPIVRAIRSHADQAFRKKRKVFVLLLPTGKIIATDGRAEAADQLLARYPMHLVGAYRGLLPASDIRADLECAQRELRTRMAA